MRAALYLRSSKDRSDVSIDAQRRELCELAKSKNLIIVEEFSDAVESGKDDNRPGFQTLLTQLKNKDRPWQYLLALDTSRIARNQYLAHVLHFECEKRDIKILYAKMPETGSVVDVVIRAVMQAFDQLHSLMSKEKGLSGMAENVKKGFRAGGRAPLGYQLQHIETGAVRDGSAVTKSKLVPGARFSEVKAFFQYRAEGMARSSAAKNSGLSDLAHTTLVGMEWNSLTYAGHTVWNVNNERLSSGGYKNNTKRRPREEWIIQYDTHEPMIDTAAAEAILLALETSSHSNGRKTNGSFLLTGLLVSPQGARYCGDGAYYRIGKGKRLPKHDLDTMLIKSIIDEVKSNQFIKDLVYSARTSAQPIPDDDVKRLRDEMCEITTKIGRITSIATEAESPRPWLEQINKLERQRTAINDRLEYAESEFKAAQVLMAISEKDVRTIIDGITEKLNLADPETIKQFLDCVVEKIVLTETPKLRCEIHYRVNSGVSVASPRLRDTNPTFRLVRLLLAA
jgi:site-specific DNA recombinase